ncbi:hypothetical protein A6R68_10335, partial [Neotoma lepida]
MPTPAMGPHISFEKLIVAGSTTIEPKDESHQATHPGSKKQYQYKDTSNQSPKPRKMDNSKAAEDNPPSQDILATSEAPFPTPKKSDTHQ